MNQDFISLGLEEVIVQAVDHLGFNNPTPVQEKCIPIVLKNDTDLVALAQTGTGKTASFGLPLIQKINNDNIRIIKNCQPLSNVEKCYVVDPKKKSKHFNTYYFYTNIDNKVNAIIAFDNKKLTNVSKCKMKMDEWVVFFESFDLQKATSENQNLSVLYSDKPHQKPLEINANCYAEKFRDVDSSFILKFYKQA